jgi:general stress protein 26
MAQSTQTTQSTTQQAEQKFMELLRGFDFAMLVSHAPNSQLHARPMAIAEVGQDGSVWFLTGIETTKVLELTHNALSLAVMQGASKYLSVTGQAELFDDREHIRRLWKDSYKVWFKGKDDPTIVLIRLRPTAAEYWDNHGAEGLKLALRFAKAYVTGRELSEDPSDVKTHAKVDL